MTDKASFFKFEAEGSSNNGLKEWETIDPNNLISGNPIQRGHIYHENPNIGYMTGVWDCTEFVDQMGPYPVDEFMLFLEGELFLDVGIFQLKLCMCEGEFMDLPQPFRLE